MSNTGYVNPNTLGGGQFSARVIATDNAGNVATSDLIPFEIDIAVTAPTVTFAPKPYPETVVFVRDAAFTRRAQLDGFSNLTYILRHHAVGTGALDINPYNRDGTPYEAAQLLLADGAGIIVVRDGLPVFSGPVTYQKRSLDNTGKPNIEVSFADDMIWLARRQLKQEPSNPAPPYSTNAYDSETNPASTVMRHFVGANLASGATSERQIPLTLASDPVLGASVNWQGRLGTQLLAALAALARPDNLGFRITQVDDTLIFTIGATTDHSDDVIFADTLGNLTDWSHERTAADANYLYVGGQGTGTGRKIVEVANSDSIAAWGRAEAFYDQRSQADATLDSAGRAQLQQTADQLAVTCEAIQTSGQRWPADYGIGDKVTAIVDDLIVNDIIREIRVDLTPDGETVTPTVGTEGAPHSTLASKEAKQFRQRLSTLEGV